MARKLPQPVKDLSPLALDMRGLGLLVRNSRLEQEMRIDDAAALLGVSTSVLSRLENGTPVGTDRLLKVLEGLGLNLLVVTKAESKKLLSIRQSSSDEFLEESM